MATGETTSGRAVEAAEVDVAIDRVAVVSTADQAVHVEFTDIVGAEAHRLVDRAAIVVFGLQTLIADLHAGGEGIVPRIGCARAHPAALRAVVLHRTGARGIGEDAVTVNKGASLGVL